MSAELLGVDLDAMVVPGVHPPDRVERVEPAAAAALVAAGMIIAWADHPRAIAFPLAAAVAVALAATVAAVRGNGGAAGLGARAGMLLTAGCAAALLDDRALAWTAMTAILVAATYPLMTPAASALTCGAVASILIPLTVRVWRPGTAGEDLIAALDAHAGSLAALAATAVVGAAGTMAGAAHRMMRISASIAEQRRRDADRAAQRLTTMASIDQLTGLPNREQLLVAATKALGRADVVGGRIGLLLVDVDRFDMITDCHGHEAGDEVLRQVARRLRAARPEEDVVARIGRSQFGILVEGVGPEGCTGIARRVIALLEDPIMLGDRRMAITTSVGIAVSAPGIDNDDELLRAAEEAVHAAQRSSRSRLATFDQALRAHTMSQATMELELREALRAGRIWVAYQPIIGLGAETGDDVPIAVEALARWTREDGSAVPPMRFLRLAEELGLGMTLGLQVLERALDAVVHWRATDSGPHQVWVNVARSQLDDPEFAHMISARLAARSLPSSALVIEIAAAELLDDEQVASTMGMLRSLGIGIAVDDFGREGSSLAALRRLPIATVKIDRTVSADLGRNDTVARAIASLCQELGITTLVDGIDTQMQLDGARRIGAQAAQGLLLGRPARAEDVDPAAQSAPSRAVPLTT